MKRRSFLRSVFYGAAVAIAAIVLFAALRPARETPQPAPDFDPATLVRPDLDAPYVSTAHEVVAAMLDLAAVRRDDYVLDLGSGDGRILIAAARERGARGLGVDIDPARIRDARFNARAAGVLDRVSFREQDLFATPLGRADVLTLYLLPEVNLRLRPRILAEMRPGARVVSNMFDMGDWRPDRRTRVGSANVYMWVVPARVAGSWSLAAGGGAARLELRQEYQLLTGTIAAPGGAPAPIEQGQIEGERLRFVAPWGGQRRLFEGRVRDGRIEVVPGAATLPYAPVAGWRAERAG